MVVGLYSLGVTHAVAKEFESGRDAIGSSQGGEEIESTAWFPANPVIMPVRLLPARVQPVRVQPASNSFALFFTEPVEEIP